jgi:sugar transferase (PEP-CTERM/EpsH1 system associated)
MQYVERVSSWCAGSLLKPIDARARGLASVRGLVTGEALSLPYYRDAAMQRWVDSTLASERIDAVVAYSSTMAQFVHGPRYAGLARIADFVDVDSDKWRQYAARSRGPKAWVYAREARCLESYERRIAGEFDATLLVSAAEAALFRRIAPECASKVSHYDNGVDTEYFDPAPACEDPYGAAGPVVVFTGAMDYWPNVEAVAWFVREVLPLVRRARPDARFAIVGSNPADEVKALASADGVLVTGRVPDVRPYLSHAAVAVAPLRIARGIQNKVLEAMAMARPVVCTPAAAEGLRDSLEISSGTSDDPQGFAERVLERLERGAVPANREYVVRHYSWEGNLAPVQRLIDDLPRRGAQTAAEPLDAGRPAER